MPAGGPVATHEGSASTIAASGRAYLFAMRRWSDFSGRSGLPELWWFIALYAAIYLTAFILDAAASVLFARFRGFRIAVMLIHAVPNLALMARRLHDIDRRGWFMVWPLVAVKALYVRGTPGPNRFGPEPGPVPGDGAGRVG